MQASELETFYPKSQKEWRFWLTKNHISKASVWLILYKKKSGKPSIGWNEAVDEALCFGWIDSKRKPIDAHKFMQFFSKRKPKSIWSKVNKAKVQKLIDSKLMVSAGLKVVETAKLNGSWNILDSAEELVVPKDLEKEFKTKPGSEAFFFSLSKSARKAILFWLVLAKKEETRQRRIAEIATLACQKLKPKQFR